METVARLFREARRRKVFRTAALYLVGAWFTLQVADVLFPAFGIPETAISALVWAAVLGFPVAIVFGWLFEVGSGGIRRTPPPDERQEAAALPLARRDYLLLAALASIAVVLVVRAVRDIRETPSAPVAVDAAEPAERVTRLANSVAVLPFANISNDPENEYFCDGVAEEILNAMSEVRALNVIGRTSSFAFKGSNAGIDRIASVLGVQYVLQGSVRKAGRQLRISAQLLDERGRQVWTQTFDRELANVFEIQDEIARAVVEKVASEVISRPETGRQPNLEAYDHYLAGRDLLHGRDAERAMSRLGRAIELDPAFAEAHAEWAIARLIGTPTAAQLAAAGAAIDRATALEPQLLRAQAARALWLMASKSPDPGGAETVLRAVLAQDPNMSDALLWLSNALQSQGRNDESTEVLQRAQRIDPLHPAIAVNLSGSLLAQGRIDEAVAVLEGFMQGPKRAFPAFLELARIRLVNGQLVELNELAKRLALSGEDRGFLMLALSYALLGDFPRAEYWVERSKQAYPDFTFSRYYGQFVPRWRGDLALAAERFEQGRKTAGVRLEDDPGHVQAYYAAVLARSGRHVEALEILQPLATPEPALGDMEIALEPTLNGWHALAWSYLHTGADEKAQRILSALATQCGTELASARASAQSDLLHYCAENALLMGDRGQALDLFGRAVAAGWRDYYRRRDDPYWAALADDPRYRELLARVKADVDRQRAEVERIDATDGFLARLEAVMAAARDARGGAAGADTP